MSPSCRQWRFRALGISLFAVTSAAAFAAAPDATLFTTYTIGIGTTQMGVSLSVCGSLPGSYGCYGGADLGPFSRVGALIEGAENINLTLNTVTRFIYVLDIATGTSKTGVTLFVYKKTDTITSTDTVSVSLFKTISLPIKGGTSARASMAANANVLFIATNQDPNVIVMKKGGFSFFGMEPFGSNVTAITTDRYGYATITCGNQFMVLGPSGTSIENGGGASFTLGSQQAFLPF